MILCGLSNNKKKLNIMNSYMNCAWKLTIGQKHFYLWHNINQPYIKTVPVEYRDSMYFFLFVLYNLIRNTT